jgi:hypothetical protein
MWNLFKRLTNSGSNSEAFVLLGAGLLASAVIIGCGIYPILGLLRGV